MVTCCLRYLVTDEQLPNFRQYARAWVRLIEKHGGRHVGYFWPTATPVGAAFSFSSVGREGPPNVALAMFSFQDEAAYLAYRANVAKDPECLALGEALPQEQCFVSYERTFVTSLTAASLA